MMRWEEVVEEDNVCVLYRVPCYGTIEVNRQGEKRKVNNSQISLGEQRTYKKADRLS